MYMTKKTWILHTLCSRCDPSLVELLWQAGAPVYQRNCLGHTPFDLAVQQNKWHLANTLQRLKFRNIIHPLNYHAMDTTMPYVVYDAATGT